MDHRQAVAVRHRQRRHGPVGVAGCRGRSAIASALAVRLVPRQPHQLRRARAARGRQQQRQIGMQSWCGRWRCSQGAVAHDRRRGRRRRPPRCGRRRRAAAAPRGRPRARRGRCTSVSRSLRVSSRISLRRVPSSVDRSGDLLCELSVGDLLAGGEHGDVVAERGEMVDDPVEHHRGWSSPNTAAAPMTWMRTLASTAAGETLCWRTVIGFDVGTEVDGQQHVVAAELRGEHGGQTRRACLVVGDRAWRPVARGAA